MTIILTRPGISLTALHPNLDVVRERNHANRLPDAQTNAGRYSSVETFDAVLFVDEVQRVQDRKLFWAVSIRRRLCHRLHLATCQFHRDEPCRENILQHG